MMEVAYGINIAEIQTQPSRVHLCIRLHQLYIGFYQKNYVKEALEF